MEIAIFSLFIIVRLNVWIDKTERVANQIVLTVPCLFLYVVPRIYRCYSGKPIFCLMRSKEIAKRCRFYPPICKRDNIGAHTSRKTLLLVKVAPNFGS